MTIQAIAGIPTIGTSGSDVIRGTSSADFIDGRGGDDFICGRGGADAIRGGAGDDRIKGQGGDDLIVGLKGNDVIRGGSGDDTIGGNSGSDRIFGGKGADFIEGNSGADHIEGNSGADEINGGKGPDSLLGNSGRDFIIGKGGDDVIRGGTGIDTCRGGPGADELLSCNESVVLPPPPPPPPPPPDPCDDPSGDVGQVRHITGFSTEVNVAVGCVADPAPPAGVFDEPDAGRRLVAAFVQLENLGDSAWFGCDSRLTLRDSEGANYDPSFSSTSLGQDFGCPTVLPGEIVSGWVVYEIIESRTPALLRWEECCSNPERLGTWNLEPVVSPPPDPCDDPSGDVGQVRHITGFSTEVNVAVGCVADPAPPAGVFDEPDAGRRLVAAFVQLENLGDSAWFGCDSRLTLRDSEGANYDPSFSSTSLGQDFGCPTVLPGEIVSGWVVYEIIESRTPALLRWEECCSNPERLGTWNL